MVEIFDEAVRRKRSPLSQGAQASTRDAYLKAVSALEIIGREERRQLARIVIRMAKLNPVLGSAEIAALAVDWYVSSLAGGSVPGGER